MDGPRGATGPAGPPAADYHPFVHGFTYNNRQTATAESSSGGAWTLHVEGTEPASIFDPNLDLGETTDVLWRGFFQPRHLQSAGAFSGISIIDSDEGGGSVATQRLPVEFANGYFVAFDLRWYTGFYDEVVEFAIGASATTSDFDADRVLAANAHQNVKLVLRYAVSEADFQVVQIALDNAARPRNTYEWNPTNADEIREFAQYVSNSLQQGRARDVEIYIVAITADSAVALADIPATETTPAQAIYTTTGEQVEGTVAFGNMVTVPVPDIDGYPAADTLDGPTGELARVGFLTSGENSMWGADRGTLIEGSTREFEGITLRGVYHVPPQVGQERERADVVIEFDGTDSSNIFRLGTTEDPNPKRLYLISDGHFFEMEWKGVVNVQQGWARAEWPFTHEDERDDFGDEIDRLRQHAGQPVLLIIADAGWAAPTFETGVPWTRVKGISVSPRDAGGVDRSDLYRAGDFQAEDGGILLGLRRETSTDLTMFDQVVFTTTGPVVREHDGTYTFPVKHTNFVDARWAAGTPRNIKPPPPSPSSGIHEYNLRFLLPNLVYIDGTLPAPAAEDGDSTDIEYPWTRAFTYYYRRENLADDDRPGRYAIYNENGQIPTISLFPEDGQNFFRVGQGDQADIATTDAIRQVEIALTPDLNHNIVFIANFTRAAGSEWYNSATSTGTLLASTGFNIPDDIDSTNDGTFTRVRWNVNGSHQFLINKSGGGSFSDYFTSASRDLWIITPTGRLRLPGDDRDGVGSSFVRWLYHSDTPEYAFLEAIAADTPVMLVLGDEGFGDHFDSLPNGQGQPLTGNLLESLTQGIVLRALANDINLTDAPGEVDVVRWLDITFEELPPTPPHSFTRDFLYDRGDDSLRIELTSNWKTDGTPLSNTLPGGPIRALIATRDGWWEIPHENIVFGARNVTITPPNAELAGSIYSGQDILIWLGTAQAILPPNETGEEIVWNNVRTLALSSYDASGVNRLPVWSSTDWKNLTPRHIALRQKTTTGDQHLVAFQVLPGGGPDPSGNGWRFQVTRGADGSDERTEVEKLDKGTISAITLGDIPEEVDVLVPLIDAVGSAVRSRGTYIVADVDASLMNDVVNVGPTESWPAAAILLADGATPGDNVAGDLVTLTGGGLTDARVWDPLALNGLGDWVTFEGFVGGNLLVTGGVTARSIAAQAVTAEKVRVGAGLIADTENGLTISAGDGLMLDENGLIVQGNGASIDVSPDGISLRTSNGSLVVEQNGVKVGDLRSNNFVDNQEGWQILQSGEAQFDAASIRGVLEANHISSNVFNIGTIRDIPGGLLIDDTSKTYSLIWGEDEVSESFSQYRYLLFIGRSGNVWAWGILPGDALRRTTDGTPFQPVGVTPDSFSIADGTDAHHIHVWESLLSNFVNGDNTFNNQWSLNFSPVGSSDNFNLYRVMFLNDTTDSTLTSETETIDNYTFTLISGVGQTVLITANANCTITFVRTSGHGSIADVTFNAPGTTRVDVVGIGVGQSGTFVGTATFAYGRTLERSIYVEGPADPP